jgi:hypothetical protein
MQRSAGNVNRCARGFSKANFLNRLRRDEFRAPLSIIPTSEIDMGAQPAPAAVRRALAPNRGALAVAKRSKDFTRKGEPRGRGSLHPGRVRSPILTWRCYCSLSGRKKIMA